MIAAAFAAWSWLRPYAWNPDKKARTKIVSTLLTADASYYWLTVHLKVQPGEEHDLRKPVRLETAAGKSHEPADTTFGGENPLKPSALWIKFWLEKPDLTGPLRLRINDGELSVRTGTVAPDLNDTDFKNFTSNNW